MYFRAFILLFFLFTTGLVASLGGTSVACDRESAPHMHKVTVITVTTSTELVEISAVPVMPLCCIMSMHGFCSLSALPVQDRQMIAVSGRSVLHAHVGILPVLWRNLLPFRPPVSVQV